MNIDEGNEEEIEEEVNEEEIEEEVNEEVEQPGPGMLVSYIDLDLNLEASDIEMMLKDDLKKLFDNKKLVLVLDLDDLLDSALLQDLANSEHVLMDAEGRPDYLIHELNQENSVLTKLRSYIHKFLKKANNKFEMYLSTTRPQVFVDKVVELLDPDNVYCPYRNIRSDKTRRIKNDLSARLGVENVVIILDDAEIVWEDHKENLIVLETYCFFAYSMRELGPGVKSEQGKDDRSLKSILDVLKRVHKHFYDPTINHHATSRDVRVIPDELKKTILGGCNILFTGVFPSDVLPEEHVSGN